MIGDPRTGKSRAMKEADARGAIPRRVVFDPYGRRDRLSHDRGAPGQPWAGVYCTTRQLLENAPALLDRRAVRIVVAPETLDRVQLAREFSAVADVLWHTGEIDLIAEECGLYGREATDAMMRLSSGGGHAMMRLFLICQSLGRIQRDGRRHINAVASFRLTEPADLKSLRERCGDAAVARISRLGAGAPPVTWRAGAALEAS